MGLLDRVGRFIDEVLLLPEEVRLRLEQAEALLEGGDREAAEEVFLEVLSMRASLPRAWVGLAEAREARGDLPGTREALREARELVPGDGALSLWASRLALQAGDVEAACQDSGAAVRDLAREGGSSLAEAYAIRGRAELRRNRPDRAARELKKALGITPQDVGLRVELVEAHAETGRAGATGAAVSGLPEDLPAERAGRVGRALERTGNADSALPWLMRGAEGGDLDSMEALARVLLTRDAPEQAETWARRAVAREGRPSALSVLASVLFATGRYAEAAEAYLAAGVASGDRASLRAAARTAPLEDRSALANYADALERVAPSDPVALAVRAWIGVQEGAGVPEAAVDPASAEPRALLARAAHLAPRAPHDSLAALEAFEAQQDHRPWAVVDRATAIAVRQRALEALFRRSDGGLDLRAAVESVVRFGEVQHIDAIRRASARLLDELDRPLLLAIVGEFNAGKSTLVNVFVGAQVAPTGVLPTTATLNVLRYGGERRARVVREDGTTDEAGWDSLKELVAATPDLSHTEIMMPSETLERVWIMDTPGTNAPDRNHEARARQAMERADAIVWVFDAAQAGKATEGALLEELCVLGSPLVAVLNKVDRLDEEEVSELVRSLEEAVGVPVWPVAAERALDARLSGDEALFSESGFAALRAHLEQGVFSRSRELKERACVRKLSAIVDEALRVERERMASEAVSLRLIESRTEALASLSVQLRALVDEEVRHLACASERAFCEVAAEIPPMLTPIASARARRDPLRREDRQFLQDAFKRGLDGSLEAGTRHLMGRLERVLADSGFGDSTEGALSPVGECLAAFRGYQHGLVDGGALGRALDDVLPRVEPTSEALAEALKGVVADPRTELRPALRDAVSALVGRLESGHRAERKRVEQARARVERTFRPLKALRALLDEVNSFRTTGQENGRGG